MKDEYGVYFRTFLIFLNRNSGCRARHLKRCLKTRNAVQRMTRPRPVVVRAVTEPLFISKRTVRAHSSWYSAICLGGDTCNRIVSSNDIGGDGICIVLGIIKIITHCKLIYCLIDQLLFLNPLCTMFYHVSVISDL